MTLAFIFITLLLSALFSGTAIAFISASKLIVELKKKKGTKRGTIIARFYEKPSEFLGVLLVGNNIMLVAFTALASIPVDYFIYQNLGWTHPVGSLFLSLVVIVDFIMFRWRLIGGLAPARFCLRFLRNLVVFWGVGKIFFTFGLFMSEMRPPPLILLWK